MRSLTMSVLIADRDGIGRDNIRKLLQDSNRFHIVGESATPQETIRAVNMLTPDILFIDEQLYRWIISELSNGSDICPLIIITAEDDSFAKQAFEERIFDYLIKPYSRERFEFTLRRISYKFVKELFSTSDIAALFSAVMFVLDGTSFKKIDVKKIIYIKAAKDYSIIYTEQGEYLSSFGIGYIEERLDPTFFKRVQRSYIVNLSFVSALQRESGKSILILENGSEISIGRSYMPIIKRLIV
ncbi:response regulator transcription factor [Sphingobacterium olei]|uniref:Response regulator transcription factor n=1 Tax=Sphingobacterium olei TaxID=2571155 RepID=A0A4U0P6I9_9SPHI|nr:LytTR family DNA-binding domain-containing protein [Sphingobacterium olei]TJZ62900.1 response regulator transcription factor [Sphingobacterium olei]